MSNSLEKLIYEDVVNYNYGEGGQGYDWHNQRSPAKVSVVDVLSQKGRETKNGKSPQALPYEIQTVSDRILKQLDDNLYIKADYIQALKNPIISEDEHSKQLIKDSIKRLNIINEQYVEIVKNLDKLSI
jgi:hypothetical protein